MAVYLVTYDLNQETKRPKIVDEVRKSPGWARLSESSYAIETHETVAQVHTRFKPHLDGNDHFFVVSLRCPWTGFGPADVIDWLEKNMPRS